MSKRRCFLVGLSNRESRKADMSRQIECKVQTVKVVIQISKSAALTLSCLDWLAQAVPTFSFLLTQYIVSATKFALTLLHSLTTTPTDTVGMLSFILFSPILCSTSVPAITLSRSKILQLTTLGLLGTKASSTSTWRNS